MQTPQNTMETALADPDGCLVDVTRIEFEVLDGRRFRWNVWQDGRRLYSRVARPHDLADVLGASKVILEAMAGIAPEGTANFHSEKKQRSE